jgi:hypothetical protein
MTRDASMSVRLPARRVWDFAASCSKRRISRRGSSTSARRSCSLLKRRRGVATAPPARPARLVRTCDRLHSSRSLHEGDTFPAFTYHSGHTSPSQCASTGSHLHHSLTASSSLFGTMSPFSYILIITLCRTLPLQGDGACAVWIEALHRPALHNYATRHRMKRCQHDDHASALRSLVRVTRECPNLRLWTHDSGLPVLLASW